MSPASTSTSFAITGLENGEAYTVSVRAINAKGYGANSVSVTATLPRPKVTIITDQNETIDLDITPEKPYDLSATAGDGSATISFTPGNDQGNAITNYLCSTNGVDYTAVDPADASSPITITGLTNGEGASITLKARNSEGDSPACESVVLVLRVTTVPVQIPYWVLGLLAGLMGWLGYRRLRLV
jgi:hypothetical protein